MSWDNCSNVDIDYCRLIASLKQLPELRFTSVRVFSPYWRLNRPVYSSQLLSRYQVIMYIIDSSSTTSECSLMVACDFRYVICQRVKMRCRFLFTQTLVRSCRLLIGQRHPPVPVLPDPATRAVRGDQGAERCHQHRQARHRLEDQHGREGEITDQSAAESGQCFLWTMTGICWWWFWWWWCYVCVCLCVCVWERGSCV